MKDGIIKLDSERAKIFNFTSDKYTSYSYLWKQENKIIISFIETIQKGNGDLSRLFNNIKEQGYIISVPTPLGKMNDILKKKGFEKKVIFDKRVGESVEIWEGKL